MDEKELVKRAKYGDVQAFGALYEKVYRKMYQYALYTLKNEQDAEDVVSETVTDAFASIKKLRSEEAFSGWIFRILSNKCKQKVREYYQKRSEDSVEEHEELIGQIETYESRWIQKKEEYLDVKEAFFELQDEERAILGMHVILGYKTKEIAAMLSMNENTVRSKESRAMQKMGNKLKGLR